MNRNCETSRSSIKKPIEESDLKKKNPNKKLLRKSDTRWIKNIENNQYKNLYGRRSERVTNLYERRPERRKAPRERGRESKRRIPLA